MLRKDTPEDYVLTTVSVSKNTRNRLRMYGHKGETYDDILNRMMDVTIPSHGITETHDVAEQ